MVLGERLARATDDCPGTCAAQLGGRSGWKIVRIDPVKVIIR